MATTTARDELLIRRFKALSDPNRLRIMDRLRSGERCVCDLQDLLDAGQSLLSFHLKTLRDAGLVIDRRDGRWTHYRINPAALDELGDFMRTLGTTVRDSAWRPVCCG